MSVYTKKDVVERVDILTGETVTIPKKWIGTEYEQGYVKAAEEVAIPEGNPEDAWTVPQIDAYAAREAIDFGDATTKPKKLEVIAAAIAAKKS